MRWKQRRPSGDCEMPERGRSPAAAVARCSSPWKRIEPVRGGVEAGDRAQRRRLAGAVGADQRDDLALLDRQRDALERLDVAVVGVDVLDLEQRHRLSPASRGRPRRPAGRRARPAGSPSAIFSPWSSTVMCSETPMTTFMSCSMSRIARPRSSRRRRMKSRQRRGLLRVHARGRLVEQQQLRVGGQRAGDLDPALVAVGEVDRELVEQRSASPT